MRIKICRPNGSVIGYIKTPPITEFGIAKFIQFDGEEYEVTHRITLADDLIKVIVKCREDEKKPIKKQSLWTSLKRRFSHGK